MRMSALLALSHLSLAAMADVHFTQQVEMEFSGQRNTSQMEVWVKGDAMRAIYGGNALAPKTVMIANKKGLFTCNEQQRTCMKLTSEPEFSVFGGFEHDNTRVLSAKFNNTGRKKKVAGYDCKVYEVQRNTETVGEGSARVKSSEQNCYSTDFAKIFPKEALEMHKKEITNSAESPAVKKALLAELALGIPVEQKSTSTSTVGGTSEKTRMETRLLSAKKVKLSPKLFQLPKGYKVVNMGEHLSGLQGAVGQPSEPTMERPGALRPEIIQQLQEAKRKGNLSPEQMKEIDKILKAAQ